MAADVHTAVILAAGLGIRLNDRIEDRPKGFIALGGRPIVEESAAKLRAAGITRTIVVTGHMRRFYEDLRRRSPGMETVENSRYADSGSMYSLYCARDRITEDFLLLESDLVYESRAIAELLALKEKDALLVSGPTGAGDEVWVRSDSGLLVDMGKEKHRKAGAVGELVGISRVSAAFFRAMVAAMEPLFRHTLRLDYESDGFVAAAGQMPMHCHRIENLVWGEIDDAGHLERAENVIYPRLEQMGEWNAT